MNEYYIGGLQLKFQDPEWFAQSGYDRLFAQPVLQVQNQCTVAPRYVPELPDLPHHAENSNALFSWIQGDSEYRCYTLCDYAKECIVSKKSGNHVEILALKNIYTERRNLSPWAFIHLEELLLDSSALVLHSAGIEYGGKAILFTAPSETGKTTQTNLWHQYRCGVSNINGDRNVLQKTPAGWYACGFPLCGSSERCEQKAVPLGLIAYVARDDRDFVEELRPIEKIKLLYPQCTIPAENPAYPEAAFSLMENLLQSVPMVRLHCTMSESAVDVLDRYLGSV